MKLCANMRVFNDLLRGFMTNFFNKKTSLIVVFEK